MWFFKKSKFTILLVRPFGATGDVGGSHNAINNKFLLKKHDFETTNIGSPSHLQTLIKYKI